MNNQSHTIMLNIISNSIIQFEFINADYYYYKHYMFALTMSFKQPSRTVCYSVLTTHCS